MVHHPDGHDRIKAAPAKGWRKDVGARELHRAQGCGQAVRRTYAVMEVKAHHGGGAEVRGDIAIAPHAAAGVEDPLPGEERGREAVGGKLLEERGLRPIELSQAAVCGPFEPKRLSRFAHAFIPHLLALPTSDSCQHVADVRPERSWGRI